MFSKKMYPWVMTFWISFFMTSIMTITFSLYNTGTITFGGYLSSLWKGILLVFIINAIIPVDKLGPRFAAFCKAKPGSFLFGCLCGLPAAIIYTFILGFAFAFFAIGFSYGLAAVFFGGLQSMPLAFIVAYPTSFLIIPLASKLTGLMVKSS